MALEWGTFNIRVNGVAPGPIEGTAGMTKLAPGKAEQLEQVFKEAIPIGHMGKKWDIAMACVFLCSPAASYVTGHVLVVDGAEWMYRKPLVPREIVSGVSRGVEGKSRAVGIAGSSGSGSSSRVSKL